MCLYMIIFEKQCRKYKHMAKTDCITLTETDLSLFITRFMRAARSSFKSSTVVVIIVAVSWLRQQPVRQNFY